MCIRDRGVGAGKALKGLLMAPAFGHIFGKPQPPQLIAVGGEDGNELDLHRAPIPQRNFVGGGHRIICLLYTSDAADERSSVDLGGRRIIKKKTSKHPGLQGARL